MRLKGRVKKGRTQRIERKQKSVDSLICTTIVLSLVMKNVITFTQELNANLSEIKENVTKEASA